MLISAKVGLNHFISLSFLHYFEFFSQREEEEEDNLEIENEETEITPAPPPQVGGAQASAAHAMTLPQAPKPPKHNKRKTSQMMAEEAYAVMNRLDNKIGARDHCEV